METDSQTFTISQLSSLLNISKPTLRFWEKEFSGILVPFRTKGGQRRYNFEHIAIVKKINVLKKDGLSLAEIKKNLNAHTDERFSGNGIEMLAERVAEIVRTEILNFFSKTNQT